MTNESFAVVLKREMNDDLYFVSICGVDLTCPSDEQEMQHRADIINAAHDEYVREAVAEFRERAAKMIEKMNEDQAVKPNWWEYSKAIRELGYSDASKDTTKARRIE